MAVIKCKECGKEMSDTLDACPHCGYKGDIEEDSKEKEQTEEVKQEEVKEETDALDEVDSKEENKEQPQVEETAQVTNVQIKLPGFLANKKVRTGLIIAAIVIVLLIFVSPSDKTNENLPIKVDISMTSYYGYIDNILDELGLDFDLVTMGANCYTGVQKNEFTTKKYGKLHTEFRYCKVNETMVFRVYNLESDQPLRDPRPGELLTFDKYGNYKSSGSSL